MGKQQVKFSAADSSGMSAIIIAIAPEVYKKYIREKIEEAERLYLCQNLASLNLATRTISDVLNINPKNAKAGEFKNKISETLPDTKN